MDRESVERLRFDRRLQQRRDWVDHSEYTSHADSLPDVSDKMTTAAELEAEEEAAAAAAPPAADPPLSPLPPVAEPPVSLFGTPGGVAGDFSSSSSSSPGSDRGGFGDDSGGSSES